MRSGLLAEVQTTLGAAIIPSLTTADAANDVYEAYLFSLVLQAARAEGATIQLACIEGGAPNPFVFRTSPGYINSRTRNYGYAIIVFPDAPPLEAHLGIRLSGHSSVLHECDVAVLFREEAELCRSQGQSVAPRSYRVVLAIEAKFYTSDLALHLGRGFLGLTRDLSARSSFFVINREARSIERLLAYKKQHWEHNVTPADAEAVQRLKYAFQIAFRDFLAMYST